MGIISEYIEKRLDADARERGLLVWLDRNGDYTALAQKLEEKSRAARGAVPVYCYQGSFLDVMAKSQEALGGRSKPRCVVHVPGMDEESIKATPLYEIYCAGQRWRVALETAVRECAVGRLSTEQVESLLSDGPITLDKAEEAFQGLSEAPSELRPLLTRYGESGLIIAFLKDPQDFRAELAIDGEAATLVLLDYFSRYLGIFEAWGAQWPGWDTEKLEDLADLLAAWMLCVEYTGDLTVAPPGARLQQLVSVAAVYRKRIGQCLHAFRQSEPELYIKLSLRIQDSLKPEEQALDYRSLGQLDTFRFEADLFLKAALDLLARNAWSEAHDIARTRLPGRRGEDLSRTFWLVNDRERQWLWDWIDAAALLGMSLSELSADAPDGPEAWVSAYAERWWKPDRFHRRFALQTDRFVAGSSALGTREFFSVRKTLGSLYREHVERLSRGWNLVCERDGFSWSGIRRQRDFYRDWLAPAIRAGQKTAVILADALRYELGKELESLVADANWKSSLTEWMLAELPTITAVGMNVLFAPPNLASLRPLFGSRGLVRGMQVGQRQVDGPAARLALLKETSDAECGWTSLEDLIKADERERRRLSGHAVLVVASREIDEMGESDIRKFGFDAFEHILASIKQAVLRLRDCGYERILITADHGFLLGDEFMENGYGARLDAPDRRYAVGTARSGDDLLSLPFPRLGYQAVGEASSFIFGRGTGCLTNVGAVGFYHGGTSLQESLVPVIELISPRYARQGGLTYRLHIETLKPVLGYQRIRLSAEAGELFAAESLELRLLADDGIEVVIADAGEARVTANLIRLNIGESTEILFSLRGPASRSKLRILPVQPGLVLAGDTSDSYFSCVQDADTGVRQRVSGDQGDDSGAEAPQPTDASAAAARRTSFHASIPDAFHTALAHLAKHGSLTEAFLVNSLGGGPAGARMARRFAMDVQSWDAVLPFRITLESSAEGKVYKVIQD